MSKTLTRKFTNCGLDYARVLQSDQGAVVVNTEGWDVASVELLVTKGTGTTWRVAVKKTNCLPVVQTHALSAAVTLQSTSLISDLLAIEAQYLVIECTTLEASHTVDVFVHLRSGDGIAVSV